MVKVNVALLSGCMLFVCLFGALALEAKVLFPHDPAEWDLRCLEGILLNGCIVEDNEDLPSSSPDLPLRSRDALAEFRPFIERSGWTTNAFVEGLISFATNSFVGEGRSESDRETISQNALLKLTEIGHPSVTNFFRGYLERADARPVSPRVLVAMFSRTNLEPEVLGYMRTLCVRTNLYARAEGTVMLDMFDTLDTMPAELKPAATNRVAKYMYFAIRHVTDSQGWQDRELATFIPAYSNSLQRLSAMRHVAATATNTWERTNAVGVAGRLSALPAGELNDIGWIADE